MGKAKIRTLLKKYTAGQLTEGEGMEFYDLLCEPGNEDVQAVFLESLEDEAQRPVIIDDGQLLSTFHKIVSSDKTITVESAENNVTQGRIVSIGRIWWAAASIIFLLGVGIYTWNSLKVDKPAIAETEPITKSFRDEVTLTMADGRKVVLDSITNGMIATQNGSSVVLNDGQLVYDDEALNEKEVVYNTLQTSKRRQFQVQLPDGTKVWLNAASSLRFPTAFTGNERRVEVTGEAYFEVAKNATKPFVVNVTEEASVKVLGTHFNINAYTNEEQIKTTLLEGSVQITATKAKHNTAVVLKPGQQAQITQGQNSTTNIQNKEPTAITVINEVDLEKAIAWKSGRFNFEGLRLDEVMKQLEQWYDIDVVFKEGVPDIEFYGELSRSSTLTEMLDALKDADVHFRIEGRKLTVFK